MASCSYEQSHPNVHKKMVIVWERSVTQFVNGHEFFLAGGFVAVLIDNMCSCDV